MGNKVEVIFTSKDEGLSKTIKSTQDGLKGLGNISQQVGNQIDGSLAVFKGNVIADFFRQGASQAVAFAKDAVAAFNEAQGAALGLASTAKFKGIGATEANDAVKNLDLVKNGLLSIGDASTAVKNLLASGFSLPQAIELIKRLGDSAAFGRQSSLSFGEAIRSATEGIKNGNSVLVDNAGVTKNLSVILKEAGFQMQDLSDKTKGAAAIQALYTGLIKETNAQVGDAAKLTGTFAGQQAQLEAAYQKVLVTVGESIAKNLELSEGIDRIIDRFKQVADEAKNSDSAFAGFGKGIIDNVGLAIQHVDDLITVIQRAKTAGSNVGIPTTGSAIQENLRAQKIPTTGNELIEFLQNVGSAGVTAFKDISIEAGKFFGQDPGKSEVDRLLEKTNKEADTLKNTIPQITNEIEQMVAAIKLFNAQDPFEKLRIDEEVRVANIKYFDDIKKKNDEFAASQERSLRNSEDGVKVISDLQAKLANNPLATFYDQAAARQKSFFDNFKTATTEMKATFLKLNSDVLALDLFKGRLSGAQAINNIRAELATLNAGGAGQGLSAERAANEAARADIIKQIQSGREAGTLTGPEHHALLEKLNAIPIGLSRTTTAAIAAIEQQIQTGKEFLEKAGNPAERQAALEAILSATSDTSKLTADQLGVRQGALQEQLQIKSQQAEQEANRFAKVDKLLDKFGAMIDLFTGGASSFAEQIQNGLVTIKIENESVAAVDVGRSFQ
jgi:hypothetical protein